MFKQFTTIAILIALLLGSCSDDSNNITEADLPLIVTPLSRTVANNADSTFFDIEASDAWTVSENAGWLSVKPAADSGNGRITVTYNENPDAQRTGSITITAPGHKPRSVVVNLIQGTNPPLHVNPSTRQVTKSSGNTYFFIEAFGSWTVSVEEDWLAVLPTSGSGNSRITVNYSENGLAVRTGNIIINAPDHEPSSVIVTVTQEASDMGLTVIPSLRHVKHTDIATGFSIKAAGPWSLIHRVEWFHTDRLSGDGDGYFRVLFTENTDLQRRGDITIDAPGHIPGFVIATVIQDGPTTGIPTPPRDLEAEFVYWDQVDLKWADISEWEAGFIIERKRSDEINWDELGRVDVGIVQFSDFNVLSSSLYSYRVRSFNATGDSPASDELPVRTHSELISCDPDGVAHSGNINPDGDMDWYAFNIVESGQYTFTVTLNDLPDSIMWLFGPDDRTAQIAYDDDGGVGSASKISRMLGAPGIYYIKVGGIREDVTGRYSITGIAG